MYSIVKERRRNGRPKSTRDLANEPGCIGHLSVHRVGGYVVASLQECDSSRPDAKPLPDLYDVSLVGLGGEIMILRGYQRPGQEESGPAYVQEWSVMVTHRNR